MLGTSSCRDPSRAATSMARPRLTCSRVTTPGLPSARAKEWFITGTARSARTMANPMRWVNETFPPRPRARWLLITMRLSASNLAGMDRTLVAVGTLRLVTMFSAVRAAAPRSRTMLLSDAAATVAGPWDGLPSGVCRAGRADAVAVPAGAGRPAVAGGDPAGPRAPASAPAGWGAGAPGPVGPGAGPACLVAAAAGAAGLPGGGW